MPSCFQLFPRGSSEPASLNKVDEQICKVLNVPVDPRKYGGGYVDGGFNWFDTIGFMIATNSDMELGSQKLRDHYLKSDMWAEEAPKIEKVLNFLQAYYTSTCFYQHKSN